METIKEEKKADLEQLLNSLIEKGWKPRGEDVKVLNTGVNTFNERVVRFKTNKGGFKSWGGTYRELISKESGLWQFVCENGMIEHIDKDRRHHNEGNLKDMVYFDDDYEYRLIESALKDESELEDFLLQNIKIEG